MMDRTEKAIKILESQGIHVMRMTNDNYGGVLLFTDSGYYFVKNDTRPWFHPPNLNGTGLAVSSSSFDRYIKPNNAHFIYSWGEREEMYIVEGGAFIRDSKSVIQTDGTDAYVYPLSQSHRFDELVDKKLPLEQKTLDLDDYFEMESDKQ